MNWRWLGWQVAFPILTPIIISVVVVLLWQTGLPGFSINWSIILDVSPWALTFYSMTLIGSNLHEKWNTLSSRPARIIGLMLLVAALAIYTAFLVIWRHDAHFAPNNSVYFVTLLLLVLSVLVCHS